MQFRAVLLCSTLIAFYSLAVAQKTQRCHGARSPHFGDLRQGDVFGLLRRLPWQGREGKWACGRRIESAAWGFDGPFATK